MLGKWGENVARGDVTISLKKGVTKNEVTVGEGEQQKKKGGTRGTNQSIREPQLEIRK